MRFALGDVKDHVGRFKIDHGPPQWRRKATQQQRGLKINFPEIFRVVRFSTFPTISAPNGHADRIGLCPVSGAERKSHFSAARTVFDPESDIGSGRLFTLFSRANPSESVTL
jgi:hypothetical protein